MFRILAVWALICTSFPAYAQSYDRMVDQLTKMNQMPVTQNHNFDSTFIVLKRGILSPKSKTVGELKDILISTNGTVSALTIDFNRLRLPGAVSLNYREVVSEAVSNSYVLNMDEQRIEERFPEFLASIDTASGGNDSDVMSVHTIIGAQVQAEDGRRLGRVQDVLFGDDGSRVDALHVEVRIGVLRGNNVAIPLNFGRFEDKNSGNKPTLMLSNDAADAMIEVAKEQ